MWKGWIIEESLSAASFLSKVKIVKTLIEENTEGDEKQVWNIHTVEIEDKRIATLSKQLENIIKPTWYAHFTDGKNLLIVFIHKSFKLELEKVGKEKENGITYFKIKPQEKQVWKTAFEYAIKQANVDSRYMIKVE